MPKTFVSRDVTFDKGSTIKNFKEKVKSKDARKAKAVNVELQEETSDRGLDNFTDQELDHQEDYDESSPSQQEEYEASSFGQQEDYEESSSSENPPDPKRYNVARDRQRRVSRPPVRYGYSDLVSYALSSVVAEIGEEPLSYDEAVKSKDFLKW